MKLLIVTQAVDREDPVLGFFHAWIEVFAERVDTVQVICLREGSHALPANVQVHSLGKERGARSKISYTLKFFSLITALRSEYDTVFVHMNPEYLVLAGWYWRLVKKRTALWYTHRTVDLKLRIAALWANVLCTASPESFRLRSPKLRCMGHGIDTTLFAPRAARTPNVELHLVTSGRISDTKRIKEMIDVCTELHARTIPFRFSIIGAPATAADVQYAKELAAHILRSPCREQISLVGPVAHTQLPEQLRTADVFLNLSTTGSVDKAVLEALAVGVPVVTTNVAFKNMLSPYGLFVPEYDPVALADAVAHTREIDIAPLQKEVAETHSLFSLIAAILALLRA